MKSILVPYDFSDSADGALAVAVELAAKHRGGLMVIHAIPPHYPIHGRSVPPAAAEVEAIGRHLEEACHSRVEGTKRAAREELGHGRTAGRIHPRSGAEGGHDRHGNPRTHGASASAIGLFGRAVARAARLECATIAVHRFPDGESFDTADGASSDTGSDGRCCARELRGDVL